MRTVITLALLPLLLSGCIGIDAYRPIQMLSIRVDGALSRDYTLFLVDEDKKEQFNQTDGIHSVELPGTTYGAGLVFFFPVSNDPEKRETVVFTRNKSDVARLSVRKVRKADRTDTGIYLIKLKEDKSQSK